jgi:hypothetical protein
MDKSGAGAGFLRELRYPLPIYIPSASPQSSSLSPEAGTIARSGRSANSLTNKKKNTLKVTLGKQTCGLHIVTEDFNCFLCLIQANSRIVFYSRQ